jgi:hypothetical protein
MFSSAVGEGDASEQAKPGWYPDPRGSGNLFYWNGSEWTGEVRSPETSGARRNSGAIGAPEGLVGGGGLGIAIAPFLAWVKVILLGNLSLFQLYEVAGSSKTLPWATVIAGLGAAAAAFIHRSRQMIFALGLCIGLVGCALALYALIGLRTEIQDAEGYAAVGIGPYVAIAGCVAMVVGALMCRPRPSSPAE